MMSSWPMLRLRFIYIVELFIAHVCCFFMAHRDPQRHTRYVIDGGRPIGGFLRWVLWIAKKFRQFIWKAWARWSLMFKREPQIRRNATISYCFYAGEFEPHAQTCTSNLRALVDNSLSYSRLFTCVRPQRTTNRRQRGRKKEFVENSGETLNKF